QQRGGGDGQRGAARALPAHASRRHRRRPRLGRRRTEQGRRPSGGGPAGEGSGRGRGEPNRPRHPPPGAARGAGRRAPRAPGRGALPTGQTPLARAGDVITLRPAGSVLVDGWVDKPGSYPVTRGLTLSGAVAAAGGHHFAADRQNVSVKRVLAGGQQQSFTVDLDAIASGRAPDVPITDG